MISAHVLTMPSSPFSRYSARITPSPLSQPTDLRADEPRGSPGNGGRPSGEAPRRDGRGPQPDPGLTALPRPAAGAAHDDPRSGYGSVVRTVFYTQSGPQVWSLTPAADQPGLPHRPDREAANDPGERTRQPSQLPQKQIQEVQSSEERLHASSITGQSGGSPARVSGVNAESARGGGSVITCDGLELTNLQQRSMQREAALNKFRLKRKDRCYEKKISADDPSILDSSPIAVFFSARRISPWNRPPRRFATRVGKNLQSSGPGSKGSLSGRSSPISELSAVDHTLLMAMITFCCK